MVERFYTLSAVPTGKKTEGSETRHKVSYQFYSGAPKIEVLLPPEDHTKFLSPSMNNSPRQSQVSLVESLPSCDRPKVLRNLQLKLQIIKIVSQLNSLYKKQQLKRRQEQDNKYNCAYLSRNDRGSLFRNHTELKKVKAERCYVYNALKFDYQEEDVADKENELVRLESELEQLRMEKQAIDGQCEMQVSSLKDQPAGHLEELMKLHQEELAKVKSLMHAQKLLTAQMRRYIMHQAVGKQPKGKLVQTSSNIFTRKLTKIAVANSKVQEIIQQETPPNKPSLQETDRAKLDSDLKKLRQEEEYKHEKLNRKENELQEVLMRIRHLKEALKSYHTSMELHPMLPFGKKPFANGS